MNELNEPYEKFSEDAKELLRIENEILRIDSHIESINSKVTSVNADPSEQAIANESGWFEDMEAIKIGLNNRKLEIQNILINN